MNEGGLVLKAKDEHRIDILMRLAGGLVSLAEAAALLGVGERQARRLAASYQSEGPRGVVHGNRGRRPARATPEAVREQVRTLATGPYAGVNHTHLAELLVEREGITVPRSTLSDILREAGLKSPRPQQRRSRHRSRRERYPQEGMLLQIDASLHDWLQGRGPRFTLLGAIDDATSKIASAHFEKTEDARGYLRLMRDICRKVGVPHALYSDRHSVFWPTNGESLKEQLAGRRSPTQFGRAMSELDIRLIAAHSPQAKGRIERLWGTLQDRLVQELRLAGISTKEDANAYLPAFIARFNRLFGVAAATPGSAYRARMNAAGLDPILCFKDERVVSKDNTVRIDDIVLQILPGPNRVGYAKVTVAIHESLDHRFSVHLDGRQLAARTIPIPRLLTPKPLPAAKPVLPLATPTAPTTKPSPLHPWRTYPTVTESLGT